MVKQELHSQVVWVLIPTDNFLAVCLLLISAPYKLLEFCLLAMLCPFYFSDSSKTSSLFSFPKTTLLSHDFIISYFISFLNCLTVSSLCLITFQTSPATLISIADIIFFLNHKSDQFTFLFKKHMIMSKLLNTEIKIFYDLAPIYSSKLISYYTYASYTSVILNYLLLPHVTF